MQPIAIVQRQTLNWENITDEQFKLESKAFCELWDKPEDYVWRLKQLWDQSFTISYFELRAELKKHALANQQSVASTEFIPFNQYNNIPDGKDWYIFIDDDDWLNPELASDLPDASSCDALHWRATNLGGPRSDYPIFSAGLNGKTMTNNYAVSGKWLNQARIAQVAQHKHAWFTLQEINTTNLDVFLSVTNKTPISSVSLERGLAGDWSIEKLQFLIADYVKKMRMITDDHTRHIPWAIQLIKANNSLFERVLASSR